MHARHPILRPILILALLAGFALIAGCPDPDGGGPVDPYAAPDFSLPDFNPHSSTWNDDRSPTDETGKVLIVYFASYS
jgi:hypothetical protein